MPDPGLVELQETLYDSRNPTRRWLHRSRLGRIHAAIDRAATDVGGTRALEIGPGSGPYLEALCERYDSVTASDIEPAYLEHVRERHSDRPGLTLVADDIAATRLEQDSFDLVLCSEVLEHTPDPCAVLAGIASVLRPGGSLVLSTPQALSTVEIVGRVAFWPGILQLARAIYREPVLPTGHISLLRRRRLRAMLVEAGFEIERGDLIGFYLPGLAEFGGERAARLQRRLAERLRGGPLQGLLWTQIWEARRA